MQGTQGLQGPQGVDGNFGGNSFDYTFDAGTSSSDPDDIQDGEIRLNKGPTTQPSATERFNSRIYKYHR